MKNTLRLLGLVLPLISVAGSCSAAADAAPAAQQQAQIAALDTLLRAQKYDEALPLATKATTDFPNSAMAFYLLGRTQFLRKQDEAARAAFDKAIELQPAFADALFYRGFTFAFGPNPEKGKADLEASTRIAPKQSKYWFELARVYLRTGEKANAAQALEKVVALDPRNATALSTLGALASERGDHPMAVSLWEKTLEIDPTNANAHFNLGSHHQLRGDAQRSLSHYLAFAGQKPRDPEALKKVIQAYYRLEDFDQAERYRLKLLDVIATSEDPKVRATKDFCFDQFDAPGGRFMVYETVNKDGPLVYWYMFKLVDPTGKVLKSINLESSKGIAELGMPFILGQNEGDRHITFAYGFEKLPSYSALKQLVLQANDGKLKASASSTR